MEYFIKKPKRNNKDLAYFCGLILGDGSLPDAYSKRPSGKYQKRYIIHFASEYLYFIKDVYKPLFIKLFGIKPRIIRTIKPNESILYLCTIESKKLYNFLNKDIGVNNGKKAKVAKVSRISKKNYLYLLAGLLDTDGGKKGNGFGLSTASKELANFCISIFKKLNLSFHSCPWYYNNHYYHQIYVHKRDFHKLLKYIPLRNIEKIRYLKSYASVA